MRRHRFDPFSFVAGLFLFVPAVLVLAGGDAFSLSHRSVRWVWPALLIVAGLAVLSMATRRTRSTGAAGTSEPGGDEESHNATV